MALRILGTAVPTSTPGAEGKPVVRRWKAKESFIERLLS